MDAGGADIPCEPGMGVYEQTRFVVRGSPLETRRETTQLSHFEMFFTQLDEADTGVQRLREDVFQFTGRTRLAVRDQIKERQVRYIPRLTHG